MATIGLKKDWVGNPRESVTDGERAYKGRLFTFNAEVCSSNFEVRGC
jgi:hypothetical protein